MLAGGCLAPTLPLPPPSRPDVEGPNAQGLVRLTGAELPNAWVFALNEGTQLSYGQVTGSDGRYDFSFPASVGESVLFWYRVGDQDSPSITLYIEPSP